VGVDVSQQFLERRAVEVAAGIGRIVITLGESLPTLRGLIFI
jgi:hypothetical protein